jgi:hypothetical protein
MMGKSYSIEFEQNLLIRKIGLVVRLEEDKFDIIHIGSQVSDIGDQISRDDVRSGS